MFADVGRLKHSSTASPPLPDMCDRTYTAAATTKELDAQLVAENTRLEKMIMGEFEKLHAHNEEVTELVQKQQVKMEQQHQESMERAAAFEESVSTGLDYIYTLYFCLFGMMCMLQFCMCISSVLL